MKLTIRKFIQELLYTANLANEAEDIYYKLQNEFGNKELAYDAGKKYEYFSEWKEEDKDKILLIIN